ncbi:MAG: PadR family transcriptional regulator [Acidimicrobiales bacterium]
MTPVLEMAILGLLKRQPMHGYDLRRRLRAEFGLLSSLSFGSLYPALARLEHDGAVRELRGGPAATSGEVLAFTGSFAGERAAFRARLAAHSSAAVIRSPRDAQSSRTRKVYELTAAGEQMFERLLTDDPSDGRGGKDGKVFAIRWAFARHLSPEARIRLLDRRRSQLEERLTAGQRASDSSPPIDRFERSLAEHARATISFEIAWVDGLICAERAELDDDARGSRPDPVVEVS